jgi:hypothetical protein
MLHNKSTGKQDVFSLESLIAWLETKPANGVYNYPDNQGCLMVQYFTAMGYSVAGCGGDYMRFDLDQFAHIPLPENFDPISYGDGEETWTYGAALKRAKVYTRTFGAALQRAKAYL